MRPTYLLFLLFCVLLASTAHAQLAWSKHSYKVPGQAVQRADFTSDGFPDLLLSDGTSLSLLPNVGNGTFDTSKIFSVKQQITSNVVILDFDRDGKLDVAGCSDAGVFILKGDGNGTLTPWQTIPGACSSLTSADFNKDGNPDLAVTVSAGFHGLSKNQVIVYFGDGQGGISGQVVNDNVDFTSSDGNACALDGFSLAADFSGDKVPDIAVTADCPNGTVSTSALIIGIGTGTGNFSFRKDQEFNFDAGMKLSLGDINRDGRNDIIAVAHGNGPHASGWGSLLLFANHGDGTFDTYTQAISVSEYAGEGDSLDAAAFVDLDGDGIQDAIGIVRTTDVSDNQTFTIQFFKGQADGSFQQPARSTLASGAFDITWGDFNKDGRADLALVRSVGNDTDVWLNATSTNRSCAATTTDRSLGFCGWNLQGGNYHFVGSPLDARPINALQLYVDGVVQFLTPDDLLDTNLHLALGSHRITAKAWDDMGAFSSVINLTVQASCTNNTNRTVHICAPTNRASFTSSGGKASLEITATAASNLNYNTTQIYVDGSVVFSTGSKTVDVKENLSTGTHRITVKGWDTSGAFSSTINVTVK